MSKPSFLVDYTQLSPNYSQMNNKVNKNITIHHMAGSLSVEAYRNVFANKSRQVSSNYGVETDSRIVSV